MGSSDKDQAKTARIQEFHDAVIGGNIDRVKAMLAEDPDLLFEAPKETPAPATEAFHAGHHDIADYLAREVLRRLKEGSVPNGNVCDAIHDLGETLPAYPAADQLRTEAEPVVARFLQDEGESLREMAVSVLGHHWNLPAYRDAFMTMMFEDPSEWVRQTATSCFGSVLEGSRDWEATRHLLRKLRDGEEDTSIREGAYEALLDIWFGPGTSWKWFWGKVLEAQRPFDEQSREADSREDWARAAQLSEESARVWESLADWDFIAALERGEEPGDPPHS